MIFMDELRGVEALGDGVDRAETGSWEGKKKMKMQKVSFEKKQFLIKNNI